MADLIIRGMEMPKNGYECPMNSFGICHVATDGENYECYDVRPGWCPLLPLPEGHGELIDKQAFIADIAGFIECMSNVGVLVEGETLCGKLLDALANAKTIVPAEGGAE